MNSSIDIPDYELLQSCGHGGYGDVFLARSRSGQHVALKVLTHAEATEKEFAGLVQYSKLGVSPHLIRILHTGKTRDGFFYTMELADNLGRDGEYLPATLTNVLKHKKRLTSDEIKILGTAILDGLNVLHAAHLVHRDVKPENILYVNGIPKLSDIGLVRSVSQTLSIVGTIGYIPPERLRSGSSGKECVDDLYALGKVLYCALTGNGVDEFPSFPVELIHDRECRKLNYVILTACDKSPFRRFKNADDFLKSLVNGISRRKHLKALLHRLRFVLTAAACFLLVLYLFRASMEPALKIGGFAQRGKLDIIPYGDGVQYLPEAGDALHIGRNPYELDGVPRRKQTLLKENFSNSQNWELEDAFNFIFWNHSLLIGEKGVIRLKQALPNEYALRCKIDCTGLNGGIRFRVASFTRTGKGRAFYEWMLSCGADGRLTVSPANYWSENKGELSFAPIAFYVDAQKELDAEMVQTEKLFHIYIDGKLVLYAPSFFLGGDFAIKTDEKRGVGTCSIRALEIDAIPHDAQCPPSAQYQPPKRPCKKQVKPTLPAIPITLERLRYLNASHTEGAMAQVFGTDVETISKELQKYDLWAASLKPGSRTRQPRTRLTAREIEKLRNKLRQIQ